MRRGHPFRGLLSGFAVALSALSTLSCAACTSSRADAPPPPGGRSTTVSVSSTAAATGTGLILPDESSGTVQTSGAPDTVAGASWPQAPRLAWLREPHEADGIRLATAAGIRWQGPTPGEFALLSSDGGYEWFGPDGSMVGCTAASACVGFAADGSVAITPGHDQPAAVYDPRGAYVGDYGTDGRTATPTRAALPLADALRRSGVEVSALVDAGTGRMPFAGGVTGDPHLITAGGIRFTTQLTGQYVARGGDPDRAIQLQFDPMAHRRDVAVVSDVAIGAGQDTIDVPMSGAVEIDRHRRAPAKTVDQIDLDSGVTVGIWPPDADDVVTVAVVWPDGGTVVAAANPVLGLTVVAHLPRTASAVGLFGAGAATGSSDLVGRSGLSQDVTGIVTSWQVTRPELLFRAMVNPVAGFPESSASVPPGAVPDADAACRAVGIEQSEDRTACVFDAGLTGDDDFIAGHQLVAIPAESQLPSSAAWALWPGLLPGDTVPGPLPAAGAVDVSLSPAGAAVYHVALPAGGAIRLVHQRGCSSTAGPGIGVAAARLFDATGHPVSARLPLCGHEDLTDLQPGTYTLVLAGATDAATRVRVDVSVGN
jgi:hypothetical protein